ncbi:MAG: hypothetical protein JW754_03595 [Candidatus Aenigmarchaeota archaeon]|nr:hypothetical protein [Candidatus Aenigmarchaeota archaeon]
MLTIKEKQVLEIIGKNLLMRKEELKRSLKSQGFDDGFSEVEKLMDRGMVHEVDAIGSICYALTKNGMTAIKDS